MDREIPKKEILMRKRKSLIKAAAVVLAAIIAVVCIMQAFRSSVYMRDLAVSDVDKGTIEVSVTASGRVTAFDEIINSPVSTRILEVLMQEGDSVNVGTVLMRLDLDKAETDYQNAADQSEMQRLEMSKLKVNNTTQLNNLEMQVKVSEMKVNRLATNVRNERYLDSLGSGTTDKVREAELAYKTALLELEQLRQQLRNEKRVKHADERLKSLECDISDKNLGNMRRTLADAQIRSPRKAVVTYINNNVGAMVNQGEKVAVVSDLSHFKVEASIADAYSEQLGIGGRVIVRIGSDKLEGAIASITPTSKDGTINFTVRLDNPSHKRLRAGLKTDVYVMNSVKDNVMRIKNGSYYIGQGDYELFVFDGDGELRKQKVKLGDSNYDYVEVISGLKPGDRVVVSDMKEYQGKNKLKVKK